MKGLVCAILAFCLLAGFCACGQVVVEETSAATTTTQSTTIETTKATTTTETTTFSTEIEQAIALFKEEWSYEKLNEIIPYHRVETNCIHEGMRQFEFTLYGFHNREEREEIEDYIQDTIYAIDISEPDGNFHQRLDGFTTLMDVFILADFNNDGYLDIQLQVCMGGSMRNEPSLFWLWDNGKQQYVPNEQLGEISQENSVRVGEDGRMFSYVNCGAWGYSVSSYSYINNRFVEVEREDVRPEDESDVQNSAKVRDTYKLINGEMVLVSTELEEEP